MNLQQMLYKGEKVLRDHSPSVLTALGVSGTISTAYLAARASWYARGRLESKSPYMTKREVLEEVWDLYIPAVSAGTFTIVCIIGAARINSRRAAAAYSVMAISEKALEEYRDKVVETIGERKEKGIRDSIALDRVEGNPPNHILITGGGEVLCCELYTGRYFTSDMESLRKAQNDINARLISQMYASLHDFYYILGLPATTDSGKIGWESDKMLQLEFTTVMSTDNRPCIAFDYNYTKIL